MRWRVFSALFGMLGLVSVDVLRADGQSDSKIEVQDRGAPLVRLGAIVAGKFVEKQKVTQRVAKEMVERGKVDAMVPERAHNMRTKDDKIIPGVMAPNRAIAKNIAGRNPIREFNVPSNATEKTKVYTHYHTHDRNGVHVWYGKPRKDW
ncbi:hypothetical protein [Helicobacter vulpis]|uniref:hypothetical protein n=1 Tax=Helicobacter vulpis TaxID=2316076 RepID=UPI000EAB627C|nr:hypothetical protein [Helicobacter vulpis]